MHMHKYRVLNWNFAFEQRSYSSFRFGPYAYVPGSLGVEPGHRSFARSNLAV